MKKFFQLAWPVNLLHLPGKPAGVEPRSDNRRRSCQQIPLAGRRVERGVGMIDGGVIVGTTSPKS